MKPNNYYIISVIEELPVIQEYPFFVRRYLSSIIVLYKGSYNANDKTSHVFEHTLPRGHYLLYGALTHIADNRILNNNVHHEWATHIYEDRFTVKKNITPLVQEAVHRFKTLKMRRELTSLYAMMVFRRAGLNSDINEYIISRFLYHVVYRSRLL